MNNKISLSVPKPCHEPWDGMMSVPGGKYCASCQKTVVDFREVPDADILEYLSVNAGPICGRFRNTQLNRLVAVAPPVQPSAAYKRYSIVLLLTAAMLQANSNAVFAQAPLKHKTNVTANARNNRTIGGGITKVSGTVLGETSDIPQFLADVVVTIEHNGKQIGSTLTDTKGEFHITTRLLNNFEVVFRKEDWAVLRYPVFGYSEPIVFDEFFLKRVSTPESMREYFISGLVQVDVEGDEKVSYYRPEANFTRNYDMDTLRARWEKIKHPKKKVGKK